MERGQQHEFSGPVTVFHERRLPERATPAGYAALIDTYKVAAPIPRRLCAIGEKHKVFEEADWRIFTPRHAPAPTLEGHLIFALKYEGLDLAVLRRLFIAAGPDAIAAIIRSKPTSAYARRIWFLYEWLLEDRLDLPDAEKGTYVPVVDPDQQYATEGELSPRHRVRNNLPGTPLFCPLVFKTERLEAFRALNLQERAAEAVAAIPKDVLSRAAAFLLLKDSKSSYAIEGESPPQDRIQRWGRAIGEAGRRPVDEDELLRLQRIVIGDARFVQIGLRTEGGFVGEHERDTQSPLPDHISARPEDLKSLVQGLTDFDRGAGHLIDPVVAAAVLAFGFVYIHPFEDGNGRIHRYLIHHVLAERGFNPTGVVFPVSAVMFDRIEEYKTVLETYSTRMLPLVDWEPTDKNNVRVLNDTADFYRYFDATPHVEFLFECVEHTIEQDLPREAEFLRLHDQFRKEVNNIVDMPDRLLDLLFRFLQQNNGQLSKRARTGEFAQLTAEEAALIEGLYAEIFADYVTN
ncbi:Fic family protein [Thalassospira sp.]|uniref:Fic family protein n=1 Tax=Thalassospira sp. TaxID=1912094 RepID=UPI001B02EA40|nr:Fic family protein [Thalassospira sp.]MBO6809249.1 Fic family protein [Thalassospira sp.]MBO6841208.1 Fic family protein [Thalassospira sp.]